MTFANGILLPSTVFLIGHSCHLPSPPFPVVLLSLPLQPSILLLDYYSCTDCKMYYFVLYWKKKKTCRSSCALITTLRVKRKKKKKKKELSVRYVCAVLLSLLATLPTNQLSIFVALSLSFPHASASPMLCYPRLLYIHIPLPFLKREIIIRTSMDVKTNSFLVLIESRKFDTSCVHLTFCALLQLQSCSQGAGKWPYCFISVLALRLKVVGEGAGYPIAKPGLFLHYSIFPN